MFYAQQGLFVIIHVRLNTYFNRMPIKKEMGKK